MVIADDAALDRTPPAQGVESADGFGRRRVVLIVLGVLVAMVVLILVMLALAGEAVRQSSEDEARKRLDVGTAVPGSTSAPAASPLTGTPTQGLYRYQGSGVEQTSFPPLTENQGPAMPATVTLEADGCWVFRIDYNTHHWQDWNYCTVDGRLSDHRGSTFSRRSIGGVDIDNTSTFVCDPPAMITAADEQSGTTHPRSCIGTGTLIAAPTTAAGTMTNLGTETIDVGGQPVAAIHIRYDLTYTGAQSGSEKTDMWFQTRSGLPVKNEHHVTVITETPFGTITYTEDATFALESAEPV